MSIQKENELIYGHLYTTGDGTFGQLGYVCQPDENVNEPTLVQALAGVKIRQVVCGSFQTWVLTLDGIVYSFGLNDEGALGRIIELPPVGNNNDDEGLDYDEKVSTPGQVLLPQKCMQLAGGEGHCAALLENGDVYAWGSFRLLDGKELHGVDYRKDENNTSVPVLISQDLPKKVIKIASGALHLIMLCKNGTVYTLGDGHLGQLGRKLPDKYRGDKIKHLLEPTQVILLKRGRIRKAIDIWTGDYNTFIQTRNGKDSFWVWVCGPNNWQQCGIANNRNMVVYPTHKNELSGKHWKQIAGGQQHTIALDTDGETYSCGRNTEGQCGVGRMEDVPRPTKIPKLEGVPVRKIAAGSRTSFAITGDNILFGWGIGEYIGLGDVGVDCQFEPVMLSEENVIVSDVDGGDQHSAMVMTTAT